MSIRYLAAELYKWERKVSELEKKLAQLGPGPERQAVELELLQARKERDHFRSLLEAKKEPLPYRVPR